MRTRPALATALLPLALLAACGDEESTTGSASGTDAAVECEFPSDGTPPAKPVEPPSGEAPSGQVPATIELAQGTIGLTLDADAAPCTVQSFTSLVEQGWLDGTE